MHRLLLICLLLDGALIQACRKDMHKDAMVTLRTYDVPEGSAAEIASVLRAMMDAKEPAARIGYAAVSPDGRQVLVTAPSTFHAGVASFVERAKPTGDKAALPPTVRLEYWVVQGKPAAERKQDRALQAIAPALDALAREYGPQEFVLHDRLAIFGRAGERAKNASAQVEIAHFLRMSGDVLDADVEIGAVRGPGILHARLNVPLDKPVVIGDGQTATGGATQYYIVRASIP
jgi:hypothetical protein